MSRLAFLFPGQGSQTVGMGRDLAEVFPESREVFAAADRALERPLSRICFEGDEAELARTENTQPAILTVSVAALRALESRGLVPDVAAGHSLGEYAAHVAAGTLDWIAALRTVQARGRFMQEAVPPGEGAMAAVLGLERPRVERLCAEAATDGVVAAANFNGPAQVVIAGHADAVERVVAAAREAGARRAVRLAVSAPFHCPLMRPAAERLAPLLEALDLREPRIPVYTNADAAPVTGAAAARDALRRQVTAPVRWQESIEAMLADGVDTFVEVGPGKVLAGLLRRLSPDARVLGAGDAAGVARAVEELAR